MRFPSQPGLIAGLSLQVTSLGRATPFWCAILPPLGSSVETGAGVIDVTPVVRIRSDSPKPGVGGPDEPA